jgi:hypothetical protein
LRKEELLEKFKNIQKLTTTKLTQWMKMWCQVNQVEANLSYKKSYEIGRFYRIVEWKKQAQAKSQSWKDGNGEADMLEDAPF